MTDRSSKIDTISAGFSKFLAEKNKRYGDAALTPLGVFGKHVKEGQDYNGILIRLDDKLSRIKNADVLRKNDVADIMGYLMLLCAAKGWEAFEDLLD